MTSSSDDAVAGRGRFARELRTLEEPIRAPAAGPAGRSGRISLLGVPFDAVTADEAVSAVVGAVAAGRGGWVVTPNLEVLRQHHSGAADRRLVDEALMVLADGAPLVWASRAAGQPLPERVAGSDLMWSVPAAAAEAGRSIFLLGGDPGTAEAAAATLCARSPGLRVAGTQCPLPGFADRPEDLEAIEEAVADARPDILFVGLPYPLQGRVGLALARRFPRLVVVGVGVSFSFVSGDVRRAPAWMQRAGLEWLYRVKEEPRRLFRRYFVDGLPFAARLLAWSCSVRLERSLRRRGRRAS